MKFSTQNPVNKCIPTYKVKNDKPLVCGILFFMPPKIDLTGKKFGKWTILKECNYKRNNRIMYECQCECGVKRDLLGATLTIGKTKSCGCWMREELSKRTKKHGLSRKIKPIYDAWNKMTIKCYDPDCGAYKDYGARGISMCDEWRNDFVQFYNWAIENKWQKGLSIDRINNDSNYEPNNCRWATSKQQQRNRRVTKKYLFFGEQWDLGEIAETFYVNRARLIDRVYKGWELHQAIWGKIKQDIWA